MKKVIFPVLVFFLLTGVALAGSPNTYQVTGPIVDIKNDVITVQKGSEKWEIAKDASTKVTGDL